MKRPLCRLTIFVAGALSALGSAAGIEAANYCQTFTDTLLDTSYNCVSSPSRDRAFQVETFTWGGGEYMIFSRGNELVIYEVATPYTSDPRKVDSSRFNFGTAGDSDYDIMAIDVCDDCRYGVIDHKVAGVVVFDLGTGSEPDFSGYSRSNRLEISSKIFSKEGQIYLIAGGLSQTCNSHALFAVNGVNSLVELQCMEVNGSAIGVTGGATIEVGSTAYLYLGTGFFGDAEVFRTLGSGVGLTLEHTATPTGMKAMNHNLAISEDYSLVVSANPGDGAVRFWDISGDPGNPVPKPSWTLNVNASVVSLGSANQFSPLVMWLGATSYLNSSLSYLIDPDDGPQAFDNAFWGDTSEPHNSVQTCVLDMDGALAPDGSALYLSRYARHQVFDLSECLTPSPAVAEVMVTPAEVFPGGQVTVRDNTAGSYDRWAVWIEKNGGFVAGQTEPSNANPTLVPFTVPTDLNGGDGYTAHVAIESDFLVPIKASDVKDITINRAPQASFTVDPEAAIIGDTVTLSATAEGSPASDGFRWGIIPPSNVPIGRNGATVELEVDQSGIWQFYLQVDYEHTASGGDDPDDDGLYEASASITDYDVGTLVADFTITPSIPFNTQVITLNGSKSKGTITSYEWTVYGPTNREGDGIPASFYEGCPESVICAISGSALEWGAYQITLAVANNQGDSDDHQKALSIGDGSAAPTFSWSPTLPENGENVVFVMAGLTGEVAMAIWDFGETGCDGAHEIQVCTPSLFNDCTAMAFSFATAGTKQVTVDIVYDGAGTVTSGPETVMVGDDGFCAGVWMCGNVNNDNGASDGTAWFGGGQAGDSNKLFAVKYELADFGYQPGETYVSAVCAANNIDNSNSGGPWSNQIFIYPDSGGAPDDSVVLGKGTILTGDGSGTSEFTLVTPVLLTGDFWLVNRGATENSGQDFNMEFDTGPNTGNSFSSANGVVGLVLNPDGNYMLRATLLTNEDVAFVDSFESGNLDSWSGTN